VLEWESSPVTELEPRANHPSQCFYRFRTPAGLPYGDPGLTGNVDALGSRRRSQRPDLFCEFFGALRREPTPGAYTPQHLPMHEQGDKVTQDRYMVRGLVTHQGSIAAARSRLH